MQELESEVQQFHKNLLIARLFLNIFVNAGRDVGSTKCEIIENI